MRLTGVHVNHVLTLNQLGLMGPDTTYIHCTDSTDEELDLIAKTGGSASVAPFVEMLMGHGVPPTGRLVARGVRPSLSIDVVSSVPGEMFTQMRTALVQERILAFTDTPDTAFAPTLTHRDVLEFATIDGARACALDQKIGTITPGKQADIILIRTDQVNVAPVVDPVGTVVISADTSNIDTVFVAGRILKHNGQLVRVDLPRLLQRLDDARDHLLSNAGVIPKWILSRRD
jgi:cytosine/adenosine deaminase-related metal-dependent hydrolase